MHEKNPQDQSDDLAKNFQEMKDNFKAILNSVESETNRMFSWFMGFSGVLLILGVGYSVYQDYRSSYTQISAQFSTPEKVVEVSAPSVIGSAAPSLITRVEGEIACRRAYKKSLRIKDGYRIPFGSVHSSVLASNRDHYVVKWPYSVKNIYGTRVEHAAECVISNTKDIIDITQLY